MEPERLRLSLRLEFVYKDDVVKVNNFEIGKLTQKLYDYLTGIQWGKEADKYGWTMDIDA